MQSIRFNFAFSHRAVKTAREVRISYGDSLLEQKRSFKYLGVIVDESLSWNSHISYVASTVYPRLKLLNRILSFVDPTTLLKIIGLFQKKSTPPRRKACWKISWKGELTALEIQMGGGL